MRLMNVRTGQLETFVANIPPYAILSHTWGDSEVTFADLPVRRHPASDKIENTCRLAQEQSLSYVWIDTCCIDKSSSAELSESINSMFKWYQESVSCYVFLEDLDPDCASFAGCKWYTRGWTLQELLAPATVEFYDKTWNLIGTKEELVDSISIITSIPRDVLKGRKRLSSISIASRMSWAAGRETSRPEDIAYSLLGLFDVHMPPIYGEGKNSFRRLQEEIIKRSNDLTILSWRYPESDGPPGLHNLGLLAESPDWFRDSTAIHPFLEDFTTRFAITNQGLYVSGDPRLRLISTSVIDGEHSGTKLMYSLFLGYNTFNLEEGGIYLRKVGPNLFTRVLQHSMAGFDNKDTLLKTWIVPDCHILINPAFPPIYMARFFRKGALHIRHSDDFKVFDAVPAPLWDHRDQRFLKSKPYSSAEHEDVLALIIDWSSNGHSSRLTILCDCRSGTSLPIARIIPPGSPPVYATELFSLRKRNVAISWEEMEAQSPDVLKVSNQADAQIGTSIYSFSAELVCGITTKGLEQLVLTIQAKEKRPISPSAARVPST